MLLDRLIQIRHRLDALQGGRVHAPRLVDRAMALLARSEGIPSLPRVTQLDRELDKVGIHTAQDAQLLRTLGVQKGRAGALTAGLRSSASQALDEFEDRLRQVERRLLAGSPLPGAGTALEHGFVRLARVVKVADVFASPEARSDEEPPLEIFQRPPPGEELRQPTSAKVAIAEFWAGRAKSNAEDVLQKRRDLDAAHELLLRLGADFDRDRVRRLRMEVSRAREEVREGPMVRSLPELVHQIRGTASQDPRSAYRALRGLYARAVEAGDAPLAGAAHAALRPLLPPPEALKGLIEKSDAGGLPSWLGAERLSPAEPSPARQAGRPDRAHNLLASLAFSLEDDRLAIFDLAAGCARFFDVEEALAEEVPEPELARPRGPRRVPYPTQRMTFETTSSLHEVNNFVISDPRTFLYDLASHRQPVRAYLEEEPAPSSKKVKRTAVRVYVCDASGSMHGPRARFRDAILIAELNNLRRKALAGQPVDPLYFTFFNDTPTALTRIDTAAQATRQIQELFRDSPAEGQTDITLALVSAFDSIRAAQGEDPYLARATVVLVTDGEDRVDMDVIRTTRAPDSLRIAFSFISLGEENPDLKALVQEQRQSGRRAFYHHLSDREISAARTEFDAGPRTLLPRDVPVSPASLELLLPHLEALERLAAGRVSLAPARPEVSFDALFPDPPGDGPRGARPPPEDLHRIADILDAIAEAGSLAPVELRGGESVTLLQHLLGLYGLTLPRYLAALALAPEGPVRENLGRVRLICRPFG